MTRRTATTAKRDDDAFPIRIKFAVPPAGLGSVLDNMHKWLRENLASDAFAVHGARSIGTDSLAVYFVRIADAVRFIDAFPQASLANRGQSACY